eukprot:CAMPEP_0118955680 /NCGR_PEP_ID=MMETSP1169-20130426/60350_1 /TAXON_ID=36882 /ORGANISM="Pyramimonas obovata, Strain CCMP722" /LENGTH=103 /DNA_ID=CAMNT_0006903571 /DNA_START=189 /DNA_END=496 /DNA_ORIENTATION=+
MAGVLQQRLSQVAREHELEVLREKMDLMRRLEDAEESARALKETTQQQSRLLEEYAREVHMARAELASTQKQLAMAKQETERGNMSQNSDLVEQQKREIVALR